MQAHPLSNSAAGNHSTQQTPSDLTPGRQGRSQPQLRAPLAAARAPLAASRTPAASASVADHAGLAHDAGNLLGALELYCNLLSLPGVLGPEHRHYATELSLISERSSELIRRLLASAASISPQKDGSSASTAEGSAAAHRDREPSASDEISTGAPVSAQTLRDLTPVLRRIADGTANVTVLCPVSLPSVNVGAEVIERITVNLVRNAAQVLQTQGPGRQTGRIETAALPRKGEIRVALAVAASSLRLTVEDNGPGMTAETVSQFLRPSALPPGAEHGLGHRIVHELASGSGGQISIRVRPGRGTLFRIAWPIPGSQPLDMLQTLSQTIAQRGFSTC